MFAGMDFGTSSCAVAIWQHGRPKLVPLEQGETHMVSALYSNQASLPVPHFDEREVRRSLDGAADLDRAMAIQRGVMRRKMAEQVRQRRQSSDAAPLYSDSDIVFGQTALENYLFDPQYGFYAKSPKSFLGAELQGRHLGLFAEIVTRMMAHIKHKAEASTGEKISDVVIGRPVNFHGTRGEKGNRQAIHILEQAAIAVGFDEVAFLYEPIAAALDYERSLNEDRTVLVLDAGAGTTDCSMIRIGPSYRHLTDRHSTLLGSLGTRIGGLDFDIKLAIRALMPSFGKGSQLSNGLPFPENFFWDALSVNDINAQARFYAKTAPHELQIYYNACLEKNKISRLMKMREERLSHAIIRHSETAKIRLSDADIVSCHLKEIEAELLVDVTREQLREAVDFEIRKFIALMEEVKQQAGVQPDAIYVTGGTAKSPVVIEAVRHRFAGVDIVLGDYLGSVTSGLATWAKRIFDKV